MRTNKPKRPFLAWLPAVLVVAGTAMTAAGISLIPSATAATANSSITVTGSVLASIAFDPTTCTSTSIPAFTAGGVEQLSTACQVRFNTNNNIGGTLTIEDSTPLTPFFCRASCAGNETFTAVDDAGALNLAGEFGGALTAMSGDGTPVSVGSGWGTADPTPTGAEAIWHPIGIADEICRNSAATTDTRCSIVFGGKPKAAQVSGADYTATANLVAATL